MAFRRSPRRAAARYGACCLVQRLAGLLVFATAHRQLLPYCEPLVFGCLGGPFEFDQCQRYVYELRKDAIGYYVGVAGFWLAWLYGQAAQGQHEPRAAARHLRHPRRPRTLRMPPPRSSPPPRPATMWSLCWPTAASR